MWKPDYKVGEQSQQYPLQSGSTPFQSKSGGMKSWLICWGTIPAVPPGIWQYPFQTLEWKYENKITRLGNHPSSTPCNLAVPLWNIRVEVWKYNYKVRDPSQQYPLKSGSTLLKHLIEGMKTWLQSWGTIPELSPSISQYPLKKQDWICVNLTTKLGNYPSSTPFNLAVPSSNVRIEA